MSLNISIADLRKDYKQQTLSEKDVSSNPFIQFEQWWKEAEKSDIEEINAMTLATCNSTGQPSARIVLLKGFDERGFVFFTNYESRKGVEIQQNPYAALVFFWKELERQVRIEGGIEKISEADSDEYFFVRPQLSRIGAWSSPQSRVIESREILENNIEHFSKLYNNTTIPRPKFWGGYILKPALIEFWQGRQGRLHDRIQYSTGEAGWKIERLAP